MYLLVERFRNERFGVEKYLLPPIIISDLWDICFTIVTLVLGHHLE